MTDRPIIFSAPMIRALLAGTKTQTRRTSGLTDVNFCPDAWTLHSVGALGYMAKASAKGKFGATFESRKIELGALTVCPQRLPYAPDDRLWVREAHSLHNAQGQGREDGKRWGPWGGLPTVVSPDGTEIAYFREGFDRSGAPRWRPSIHMPRWASRITLTVTDVRVQRVQNITEADAMAEGIVPVTAPNGHTTYQIPGLLCGQTAIRAYAILWDTLHGPGAWRSNPWVEAVSFTVHQGNIDDHEAT